MEFAAFAPRYSKSPQNFETKYAAHLYVNSPGARPMVLQNLGVSFVSHKAGGLFMGYWNPDKIDQEYVRLKSLTSMETCSGRPASAGRGRGCGQEVSDQEPQRRVRADGEQIRLAAR